MLEMPPAGSGPVSKEAFAVRRWCRKTARARVGEVNTVLVVGMTLCIDFGRSDNFLSPVPVQFAILLFLALRSARPPATAHIHQLDSV